MRNEPSGCCWDSHQHWLVVTRVSCSSTTPGGPQIPQPSCRSWNTGTQKAALYSARSLVHLASCWYLSSTLNVRCSPEFQTGVSLRSIWRCHELNLGFSACKADSLSLNYSPGSLYSPAPQLCIHTSKPQLPRTCTQQRKLPEAQ